MILVCFVCRGSSAGSGGGWREYVLQSLGQGLWSVVVVRLIFIELAVSLRDVQRVARFRAGDACSLSVQEELHVLADCGVRVDRLPCFRWDRQRGSLGFGEGMGAPVR